MAGEPIDHVLAELREAERDARLYVAGDLERTFQAQLDAAHNENATLAAQLEVSRGRLDQQAEAAEAAAKANERALGDMRHKLATQAHQLKASEAESQRLRQRLSQELSERDAAQKQRERQVFQEVHRRAPRAHSAADTRSLEVIEVYEAQRRKMQAEIDELRSSTAQLSADLREKENLIARKDSYHSWRTPDEGELLVRLQQAQADAQEARDEAQHAESRAAELLRSARLAESEARREAEMDRARSASLELELSARPSQKQWREAQATIERLSAALPPLHPSFDGDDDHELRAAPRPHPAIDSAEAIRRDRDVHALGLHAVRTMPTATMVRLLQDACRELQLSDAQLLPSAVRKTCRALAALPPMEAFIRDVCGLALSRGTPPEMAHGKGAGSSTRMAMQVLQGWAKQVGELDELRDLMAVLSSELGKRATALPNAGASTLAPRDLLASVGELVSMERKALRAIDTFERADLHLRVSAEDVLSKLCNHFGRLFGVKGTEGMLPKMNELYLFVNEQNNLMKVLRSMLGLPTAASSHALLSSLRKALDSSTYQPADTNARADDDPDAAVGRNVDEPPKAPRGESQTMRASVTGSAAGAAATVDDEGGLSSAAASRALPQYVAIAAELRQLMQARSILAIVPSVRALKQELADYQRVHKQMNAHVTKLCAALAEDTSEGALARQMQSLVAEK